MAGLMEDGFHSPPSMNRHRGKPPIAPCQFIYFCSILSLHATHCAPCFLRCCAIRYTLLRYRCSTRGGAAPHAPVCSRTVALVRVIACAPTLFLARRRRRAGPGPRRVGRAQVPRRAGHSHAQRRRGWRAGRAWRPRRADHSHAQRRRRWRRRRWRAGRAWRRLDLSPQDQSAVHGSCHITTCCAVCARCAV